jgi:hypothetical protein
VAPDEQGQGLGRPERDERPLPEPRRGRGQGDRPRLRRVPDRPVESPEEKSPDANVPAETDTDSPAADTAESNES